MNFPATTPSQIDQAVAELHEGARSLASSSIDQRMGMIKQCIEGVVNQAESWCEAAWQAKQATTSASRAEEIFVGPLSTIRFMRLTLQSFSDLKRFGKPTLPGNVRNTNGQLRVPVFPTRQLFDSLIFSGLRAECWLQPAVDEKSMFGNAPERLLRKVPVSPSVELVLGAGNVSAIPITDALTKILHEDQAVLLKMNPVNEYLGPFFNRALRPLVQAGWLRIIYGGNSVGSYACHHSQVERVHITGSADSHEMIVWGSDPAERENRKLRKMPLLSKPISSELGNVTPWIIVPGKYTDSQLRSQAESIAASIINNASFNCVATKLILTSRQWPQRESFLRLLSQLLSGTPPRYAYYPGAAERYAEFSGAARSSSINLPWCLKTDIKMEDEPLMFQRESFVCVAGECALDIADPLQFLENAVEFANSNVTGTLAVELTVPDLFQRNYPKQFDQAIQNLRYGTIGINQWSALGFAWMSTPWGGYPGATLQQVDSGIGSVHNTFLLNRPQKSVIFGSLKLFPKPVWFSNHRCPEKVARKLLSVYATPSLFRLPGLFAAALRG